MEKSIKSGRKKLNHVQYKRNIHPELVEKMDVYLEYLKKDSNLATHN